MSGYLPSSSHKGRTWGGRLVVVFVTWSSIVLQLGHSVDIDDTQSELAPSYAPASTKPLTVRDRPRIGVLRGKSTFLSPPDIFEMDQSIENGNISQSPDVCRLQVKANEPISARSGTLHPAVTISVTFFCI